MNPLLFEFDVESIIIIIIIIWVIRPQFIQCSTHDTWYSFGLPVNLTSMPNTKQKTGKGNKDSLYHEIMRNK